jgi:hypothetical protein
MFKFFQQGVRATYTKDDHSCWRASASRAKVVVSPLVLLLIRNPLVNPWEQTFRKLQKEGRCGVFLILPSTKKTRKKKSTKTLFPLFCLGGVSALKTKVFFEL